MFEKKDIIIISVGIIATIAFFFGTIFLRSGVF